MSFYLFFFVPNSLTRPNNPTNLHLGITIRNIWCRFRRTLKLPFPNVSGCWLSAWWHPGNGRLRRVCISQAAARQRRRAGAGVAASSTSARADNHWAGGERARLEGVSRATDGVFFKFLLSSCSPVTVIKTWKKNIRNTNVSFLPLYFSLKAWKIVLFEYYYFFFVPGIFSVYYKNYSTTFFGRKQ
jgi:hypothetical protein